MDSETAILLKEYELHRKELHLRMDHRIKGLTFLFASLFVIFGIGIKESVVEIFLVLPWFLNIAFAFIGYQLMCSAFTSAYLQDLEKRIKVLDYQRFLEKKLHRDPPFFKNPYKILNAMIVLPLFGVFALSLYLSHSWFLSKFTYAWFVWITSFVFILTLIVSAWGIRHDYHLPKRDIEDEESV